MCIRDRTDTIQAGVGGAEISYTPDIVTDVYSNTLLLLFLDDLAGSRLFRDDSGRNRVTLCTTTACPAAGVPGRFGRAIPVSYTHLDVYKRQDCK